MRKPSGKRYCTTTQGSVSIGRVDRLSWGTTAYLCQIRMENGGTLPCRPVAGLSFPRTQSRQIRRRRYHRVQQALGRVLWMIRRACKRRHEAPPVDQVDRLVWIIEKDVDEPRQRRVGREARPARQDGRSGSGQVVAHVCGSGEQLRRI